MYIIQSHMNIEKLYGYLETSDFLVHALKTSLRMLGLESLTEILRVA